MKKAINITAIVAVLLIIASVVYVKLISKDKSIYISTGFGENVVAKVDGQDILASEVLVLLADAKIEYEEMFGQDIWNEKMGEQTFDEYVMQMIRARIVRQKCMNVLAKSRGIVLSSTEEQNVEKAASEYMEQLPKNQAKALGATKQLLKQMYTEAIIAKRIFEDMTLEVNTEVSEDEARVISIQYIRTTDLSKANQAIERLNAGESFMNLIKENNPYEYEYILKRGEVESNLEQAAFALASGEMSPVIQTTMGYYIVLCVNDYDRVKTASNKEKIITQRRLDTFNNSFEEYEAKQYAEYNEKEWAKFDVKNMPVCETSFNIIFEKIFN